ncbi:MAG: PH domain-containing protein [Thermoplasmata archaeon]|nr:PH domain-containing protein [Thermoplasmata archaeon]
MAETVGGPSSEDRPTPPHSGAGSPAGRTDAQGVYHQPAPISFGMLAFYLLLMVLLIYASSRGTFSSFPFITELLIGVFLLFLVRSAATRYRLDAEELVAWRIFGNRRIRLETVRKIEYANLRDLGPVGMFGSWGWRGRLWSPIVGSFDAIQTVSSGLLVTAGTHPLFISPKDPDAFAQELSRRVRSYTGPLETDVGNLRRAATPSGF